MIKTASLFLFLVIIVSSQETLPTEQKQTEEQIVKVSQHDKKILYRFGEVILKAQDLILDNNLSKKSGYFSNVFILIITVTSIPFVLILSILFVTTGFGTNYFKSKNPKGKYMKIPQVPHAGQELPKEKDYKNEINIEVFTKYLASM